MLDSTCWNRLNIHSNICHFFIIIQSLFDMRSSNMLDESLQTVPTFKKQWKCWMKCLIEVKLHPTSSNMIGHHPTHRTNGSNMLDPTVFNSFTSYYESCQGILRIVIALADMLRIVLCYFTKCFSFLTTYWNHSH